MPAINTEGEICIQSATIDDIPFIQSLVERFAHVGMPPWRNPEQNARSNI